MTQDQNSYFLNVKSVAKRYSISVSTVWQWTKDGILPKSKKIGKRTTRWSSAELDEHDKEG